MVRQRQRAGKSTMDIRCLLRTIAPMLDPEQFVARCLQCLSAGGDAQDIARLLPQALVSQREEPGKWNTSELLHCSDDLLIVNLTLPPFATSAIHDHRTWAVIGISQGCEIDELFVERAVGLAHASSHELRSGDVLVLDPDCIHFIANPTAQPSRGIHVYGKNLALTNRRMWDPQTCTPRPMDFKLFEQWEQALTGASTAAGAIVPPVIR
jgi:predicted metal-dependent enzyme (double-stranded beta helix superfamily)